MRRGPDRRSSLKSSHGIPRHLPAAAFAIVVAVGLASAQEKQLLPAEPGDLTPLELSVRPDGRLAACMHECSAISMVSDGGDAWMTSSDAVIGIWMQFSRSDGRLVVKSISRNRDHVVECLRFEDRSMKRWVRSSPADIDEELKDDSSHGLVLTADGEGVVGVQGLRMIRGYDRDGRTRGSVQLDVDLGLIEWVDGASRPSGVCKDSTGSLVRFGRDGRSVWRARPDWADGPIDGDRRSDPLHRPNTKVAVSVDRGFVLVKCSSGVDRMSDGVHVVAGLRWDDGRTVWTEEVSLLDCIAFGGPNDDWLRVRDVGGTVVAERRSIATGRLLGSDVLADVTIAAAAGVAKDDWVVWTADHRGQLRRHVLATSVSVEKDSE